MFVIKETEIKIILQSNKIQNKKRGKGQTAIGEILILSYPAERTIKYLWTLEI